MKRRFTTTGLLNCTIATIAISLLWAPRSAAQLTDGKKPELPAPFATKSANNSAEEAKPPKGFLPTVPAGFKINVFAADFKQPRWMQIAPNGDIFLADTAAGKVVILRDPQHTGSARKTRCLSAACANLTASFFTTTTFM